MSPAITEVRATSACDNMLRLIILAFGGLLCARDITSLRNRDHHSEVWDRLLLVLDQAIWGQII